MNTKKLIATTMVVGILSTNFMPLTAHAFVKKNNVLQSQVTEYKFQNVNLEWWKNYNDELLEGYIVKAIDENQDLKIATLRVEEARQNIKLQFSKELPTANIGVSPALLKNQGETSSEGLFGVPLYANYEADIFLKNHDKTKSVKKRYEVSKLDEKAAYISVASYVGATYFNIVKLDKLISIEEEIVADRKQIFELMKIRNQQGITSTADMVRAEKSYVLATAALSDLKKNRTIVLNSFAVLIGESPVNIEDLKRISYDELSYDKAIPTEISSEIITQRPDYLAAEKMVEKAGIDVRVAKKEFLPNVNLLGLLFFSSTSLGSAMNWTNALAALGGSALLPIFTGGAKTANLKLNKNKYEQVMQNYYKTNLVAIQEVNDSLCSLKFDDEKYNQNVKSLNMQKADFKYTQQRYNQGVISKLDMIQQKENLLTMNKMVTESKTSCYIDQIGLYKAVGGKL